jgi:hypothetical protein
VSNVSVAISRNQNSPDSVTLMRAITVAHRRAQRAQTSSLIVSGALAALSVLAAAVPSLATAIALLGAAWAVAYSVLVVPWSYRGLRQAATLQEMFDVDLFELPWNHVTAGPRLSAEKVSQLSRGFRGDESELRDYYLVPDLPYPKDMLFCLEQNLAWGPRVRQRYAYTMAYVVGAWCVAGVVVGFVRHLTVADLIMIWFVPSLGLLLLCLDIYRTQTGATREREVALGVLRARQEESHTEEEWVGFARQLQDVIFQSRQRYPRVPHWFFRRFHDSDRTDFQLAMRQLEIGG